MLIHQGLAEEDREPLPADVDGESDVFVDGLRRRLERFTEDIEEAVAADEADKVIAPTLRLRKWIAGRFGIGRETELGTAGLERSEWGLSTELAVPIPAVVAFLEAEALLEQLLA